MGTSQTLFLFLFFKCFNNCKDGSQDSLGRKDGTMHSITYDVVEKFDNL